MGTNDTLYWFAIHVKSRHESQVNERLSGSGIDTFLPTIVRLNTWKDRNKLVKLPLFAGYLFVHIKRNHNTLLTVLRTKGVVRILGNSSGDPEPVPEDQILFLRKLVEIKTSLDPYPYLQEGQRVRIKRGPLAGIEGILVEKSGLHKLILSVDILRQSTSLRIDVTDVENV